MDNQQLQEQVDELSIRLNEQVNDIEELRNEIRTLNKDLKNNEVDLEIFDGEYERHSHSGYDRTAEIDGTLKLKSESWLNIGNTYRTDVNAYVGTTSEINRMYLGVGSGNDTELALSNSTKNTQITVEHLPGTTGAGLANASFIYAFRPPVYIKWGGIGITSGGSTITNTDADWVTNELSGAYVNVFDSSSVFKETRLIASNTGTVITISGTFSYTDANSSYSVFMPVYMGSAEFPWRRLYTISDIRLGMGTSTGSEVCYIKHGTATPEGAVTAQVGSLFLRMDGGANTTLYVKESTPATTTDGVEDLSGSTITVAATADFAASGTFVVDGQTITYTGKTAGPDTFTGCTGGIGNSTNNAVVTQPTIGWVAK